MASLNCPLKDKKFIRSVLPMKLHHLLEIEHHLASSNDCPHPCPKFVIFDQHPGLFITPMQLACQNGELDSVKHLVETWEVDVQASFKYCSVLSRYYPPYIGEVTPLFVAAFNGRNNIVRYLLSKGADVSAKSISQGFCPNGFTPLYGAVSEWHYDSQRSLLEQRAERIDIVSSLLEFGADPIADSFDDSTGKPMWMERMCGIDATTILINHGIDLKRHNPWTGETLLHFWAGCPHDFTEEDSLAIVKLLVDKGAGLMAINRESFTPLHTAANKLKFKILDYLMKRDEYDRIDKMIAMELAGAAILFEAENAALFPKAFEYWRRAHQLRQMEIEEFGPCAEKILGRKIGNNVEWTTLAELDQLEQHPEDYRIQALLVKLRIFSGFEGYCYHHLSNSYITFLSESTRFDEEEKFIQILGIRWGMLDFLIRRPHPHFTNGFVWIVYDVARLVSTLETLRENHSILFNFETIKTSLDLILLANYSSPITITNGEHSSIHSFMHQEGTEFSKRLLIILQMFFRLLETRIEPNKAIMTESLRLLGPHGLGNLLLPACRNLYKFNNFALIRALLEAGADPNVAVVEDTGNASLHIVAALNDQKLGDAAGRLLIEFGAKLHLVNKAGKTALDIWIELNETEAKWIEEAGGWSDRPEWCCPLPTLLCLATRVIRVHKLPYSKGKTPVTLHPLIELR